MKREATIILKVELSADSNAGIETAAMEALSYIKCDIAMYNKDCGAFGAKIIDKGFEHHDEDRLFDLVLETSGINEKEFLNSGKWNAALARNLFGYFAKKYLEWDWNKISKVVQRDRSTVATGVRDLIGLVTGSRCGLEVAPPSHRHDLAREIECYIKKANKTQKELLKELWTRMWRAEMELDEIDADLAKRKEQSWAGAELN